MHTCGFCKDPIPAYSKPRAAHLVVGKDSEGHIHTHGDLDKKELMQEMLDQATVDLGLTTRLSAAQTLPAEVVFHNRQRIGDMLMFTCGVRDFKQAFPKVRVNVVSIASHIFDHNPYIDRTLEPTPQNTIKIGPGKLTNSSNRLDWHFANAYRVSIEDALKIHIPQGESRPDIWLTEEEYNAPRLFEKPYWIICVNGEKGWGCKMYPFDKWQEVVDQNPDITFVQIGTKEDDPPRLSGPNVIDHVGKTQDKNTGIRDLFKLFLNAEGSIGLVSFHMHLSGALYKPAVVVAGAREPVSFTRYAGHQYLSNDGCLPCADTKACWHCDIDTCTNLVHYPNGRETKVPKCADMIEPSEISQAIRRYYLGGRLKLGEVSKKPKLKNIVKTPPKVTTSETVPEINWGKGAIDPKDWPFMKEVIEKHQVKTVLEFGAGLSTVLMSDFARITSFETEQEWIDKVVPRLVGKTGPHEVIKWNGRSGGEFVNNAYDLAFVDGPANGQNREEATRLAANAAKIVIMHDATREWETRWEEKYLKPGFQGPFKGGKWCHLWIKTASFVPFPAPIPAPVRSDRKTIKIVSTARGWGGCARSVTTIMKMLLDQGHSVEFIPFRHEVTSREFIDALKNSLMDVKVTKSFETLKEKCDALLVYADDYVWEFGRPDMQEAFSNIGAERKIMMINYRRGGIGEIEWTKGWDKYLFLNSAQEKDLLRLLPGVETGVLPPCTDLSLFFTSKPNFEGAVRIVRHNSQGDVKFTKDGGAEINQALATREDLEIHMMPGPTFIAAAPPKFVKYSRNNPPIYKFLEIGNLFWYSLPPGYMDMGPRVILEAMAAGLPILADTWGGAVDRVRPECGWILPKEEQIQLIKNVSVAELKAKGAAARERALKEFRPERWIEELTGELCTAHI